RVQQRFAQVLRASACADGAEVWPERASESGDHVAIGAAPLVPIDFFSAFWISGERRRGNAAERPHICHKLAYLLFGQRGARHPRSGNAAANNASQRVVVRGM